MDTASTGWSVVAGELRRSPVEPGANTTYGETIPKNMMSS